MKCLPIGAVGASWVHNVHVNSLHKFAAGRSVVPPSVPVDANIEYEIEKLLDSQKLKVGRGNRRKCLAKWVDYGTLHDTWEPVVFIIK